MSGYPGTPSTEVLEAVAKRRTDRTYVEWSVNEKAGLEVAAGAAYTGARTMVTMKQVGLNVATDPLMSLAYIGVKGGMVIMVADDPGPISSQTEQDTRTFGMYSKLPVFDPTGVQEAYDMMQEAFAFSEKHHTPVIFRSTTRISHAYGSVSVRDESEYAVNEISGFEKKPEWVIFPRLSFNNHRMIEERNVSIGDEFSDGYFNRILPAAGLFTENKESSTEDIESSTEDKEHCIENNKHSKKGIATHGINFDYTMENLNEADMPRVLKVATPFPFPEKLALEIFRRSRRGSLRGRVGSR